MNKSASMSAKKVRPAPPGGNALIRLVPDPSPPWGCLSGAVADPAMFTSAVTHGCVDWFNYESHPLQPDQQRR